MCKFFSTLFSGLDTLDKRVTFCIAIVAFAMTTASWCRTLWLERTNVKISVVHDRYDVCFQVETGEIWLIALILFENKSTAPISINSVHGKGTEISISFELK